MLIKHDGTLTSCNITFYTSSEGHASVAANIEDVSSSYDSTVGGIKRISAT